MPQPTSPTHTTRPASLDASGTAWAEWRAEGARGRRRSQSPYWRGKVMGMEGPPPPQRVAITEWESLDKHRHSSSQRNGAISDRSVTRRSRPCADMRLSNGTDNAYRGRNSPSHSLRGAAAVAPRACPATPRICAEAIVTQAMTSAQPSAIFMVPPSQLPRRRKTLPRHRDRFWELK